MNTQQPKSKWKTWHKVVIGLIILAIIGAIFRKEETTPTAVALTQAQKDSIAFEKNIVKGKREAEVNLRTYVIKSLNDPKSFDVLNQKTWVVGSTIIVMIEYTAKNGFGGVVKSTIKAEADSAGNLTKIFK